MEPRRLIGYWRNDQHPEYPDPKDWIDESWDADERDTVWAYLVSGTMAVSFMGFSPCRLCGDPNGAMEFADSVYQWPEGLAHYVDAHAVRLPADVVHHAVTQLEALEATPATLDWWANTMRRSG